MFSRALLARAALHSRAAIRGEGTGKQGGRETTSKNEGTMMRSPERAQTRDYIRENEGGKAK